MNRLRTGLYLRASYPDMATFHGMDEKMDPIMAKVTWLNYKQVDEASVERTPMRTCRTRKCRANWYSSRHERTPVAAISFRARSLRRASR